MMTERVGAILCWTVSPAVVLAIYLQSIIPMLVWLAAWGIAEIHAQTWNKW